MPDNTPDGSAPMLNPHPIQMNYVGVSELHIICHEPPDKEVPATSAPLNIAQRVSEFDDEARMFMVSLSATIASTKEKPSAFSMKVTITAQFTVDASIPPEKALKWGRSGAQFVMFPFLREQMFALTSRAGYQPVLLPLVQLPALNVRENEAIPTSIT